MAVRAVEGKKPYTGGKAIEITEDKVINLRLRDENNLIIYDEGDDEIYVDLQLDNEIEPTDAFPVGITTGRVIIDNGWDMTGTLICAKTTSGDNIKVLYSDQGELFIDNGTGTFKQIYLKPEIDEILQDYVTLDYLQANYPTTEYVDSHDTQVSDIAPANPTEGMIWYDTTAGKLKVYDGLTWNDVGSGGGSYTAGNGINIDANDEISVEPSEIDVKDLVDTTNKLATVSATAPSNATQGQLWYDTTTDILKTFDGANWNGTSNFPGMTILSYGNSTWNDFLNAYNNNAIVYCRASSNANPATGTQGRMAFMAFVSITGTTPTSVEFQYYRSRASNTRTITDQTDEVYVYKLTNTGVWTVETRNTGVKIAAGTGLTASYNNGTLTISLA